MSGRGEDQNANSESEPAIRDDEEGWAWVDTLLKLGGWPNVFVAQERLREAANRDPDETIRELTAFISKARGDDMRRWTPEGVARMLVEGGWL